MQLMMRPELLAQETSTEYNWRHLEKHIQHVTNTEAKSMGIRWNTGHIEPIIINLGDDSFSDELSPNKVVTTATVLMSQWVRYNFVMKPHVYYMYYFKNTFFCKGKNSRNKMCSNYHQCENYSKCCVWMEWPDNKRIAMLLP